jgi:hypothetical protein
LNLRSVGSKKPALATTSELMTPEFGVIRAARASAVAVKMTDAATNRTAKRFLLRVAIILECLIIGYSPFVKNR